MKIIAAVKFNQSIAYVLDKKPELIYKKVDGLIYGTDGIFYQCYKYDRPSKNWQAFGGREFEIKLETGDIVKCNGQWWNGGFDEVGKLAGCTIGASVLSTVEELKKCYVFSGYEVDMDKFKEFIKSYTDMVYPYREYEKIIRYDDEINKWISRVLKLERDKKNLIKEVKRWSNLTTPQS